MRCSRAWGPEQLCLYCIIRCKMTACRADYLSIFKCMMYKLFIYVRAPWHDAEDMEGVLAFDKKLLRQVEAKKRKRFVSKCRSGRFVQSVRRKNMESRRPWSCCWPGQYRPDARLLELHLSALLLSSCAGVVMVFRIGDQIGRGSFTRRIPNRFRTRSVTGREGCAKEGGMQA